MLNREKVREIWTRPISEHKELLEIRAESTIEKHRKGYCELRFKDKKGDPIKGKEIKITQNTHDFKYGANIFMLDEFSSDKDNLIYRESFKKYFNLATVPFYWDGLEPEAGKPRFNKNSSKVYRRPAPELCVEYCNENGIAPKLHCLVYDKFIPDWLPKNDLSEMERLYEERFRQISERYSGRLYEFEVINELLCEPAWNTQSVISKKPDIVEWAFNLARKYFPNEVLVFNEANQIIDAAFRANTSPYYLLLKNALLSGLSIDKIGLQHHEFRGTGSATAEAYEANIMKGSDSFNPEKLYKGLDIFASLKLPLEITEITVPTFGDTEEDEELQADLLEALYTVCFGHEAINTMVYWNVPDGYAYANPDNPLWDENRCRGGLWHHDLTPKKSAERLWELFNKKWHTELSLTTDENGYIEFRGFLGNYTAEISGLKTEFGIHKNNNNYTEIKL